MSLRIFLDETRSVSTELGITEEEMIDLYNLLKREVKPISIKEVGLKLKETTKKLCQP